MKASLIIVVFLIAPSCALTPLLMSDIPQHILEITKSHMSLSQLYQYPFQSPSLCQQIRLQACQYEFNAYLGIPTDADWRDPLTFQQELINQYMKGPDGLVKVCRANSHMFRCLGNTYWACYNPLYLVGRNFGVDKSFLFSSEMLRIWFQCTGGMEQSINQWGCIGQAYNSSMDAINSCRTAFNATISSDPSYNAFCQATQTFMNCFSQQYATCGPTVQWWACEDARVGFSLFLCPALQCQVNSGDSKDMSIGYNSNANEVS